MNDVIATLYWKNRPADVQFWKLVVYRGTYQHMAYLLLKAFPPLNLTGEIIQAVIAIAAKLEKKGFRFSQTRRLISLKRQEANALRRRNELAKQLKPLQKKYDKAFSHWDEIAREGWFALFQQTGILDTNQS